MTFGKPQTFLTVNAAVAPTRAEAEALLLPTLQMMARLRTGQPLGPLGLVEDASTSTKSWSIRSHRGTDRDFAIAR